MPDYIDTREPGWRRTTPGEDRWPNATARIEYFEDGREIGWVREPVIELPTAVGTVIAVDGWRFVLMDGTGFGSAWFLLAAANFETAEAMSRANVRTGAGYSSEFVLRQAAKAGGFKVLAEPPIVDLSEYTKDLQETTTKAVLGRVLQFEVTDGHGRVRAEIREQVADLARDYGVQL